MVGDGKTGAWAPVHRGGSHGKRMMQEQQKQEQQRGAGRANTNTPRQVPQKPMDVAAQPLPPPTQTPGERDQYDMGDLSDDLAAEPVCPGSDRNTEQPQLPSTVLTGARRTKSTIRRQQQHHQQQEQAAQLRSGGVTRELKLNKCAAGKGTFNPRGAIKTDDQHNSAHPSQPSSRQPIASLRDDLLQPKSGRNTTLWCPPAHGVHASPQLTSLRGKHDRLGQNPYYSEPRSALRPNCGLGDHPIASLAGHGSPTRINLCDSNDGEDEQPSIAVFVKKQIFKLPAADMERAAPLGLSNLGNTCYMNSVLQVLFTLPTFKVDLLSLKTGGGTMSPPCPSGPATACNDNKPASEAGAGTSGGREVLSTEEEAELASRGLVPPSQIGSSLGRPSLTWGLSHVLHELEEGHERNLKFVDQLGPLTYGDPKPFRRQMKGLPWESRGQQDAHEFFVCLLERLQAEVLGTQVKLLGLVSSPAVTQQVPSPSSPASLLLASGAPDLETAPPSAALFKQGHATEPPVGVQTEDRKTANTPAGSSGEGRGAAEAFEGLQANVQTAAGAPEGPVVAEEATIVTEGMAPPPAPAPSPPPEVRLRLNAAMCPGERSFSGCLLNTYRCQACGHVSMMRERFTHLSLQLPPTVRPIPAVPSVIDLHSETPAASTAQDHSTALRSAVLHRPPWDVSKVVDGEGVAAVQGSGRGERGTPLPPSLGDLLDTHFQMEHIDKTCDSCSATNAPHSLHHQLLRLPQVLALHLKRFEHVESGGQYRVLKVHAEVGMPRHPGECLDLASHCVPGVVAHPLLSTGSLHSSNVPSATLVCCQCGGLAEGESGNACVVSHPQTKPGCPIPVARSSARLRQGQTAAPATIPRTAITNPPAIKGDTFNIAQSNVTHAQPQVKAQNTRPVPALKDPPASAPKGRLGAMQSSTMPTGPGRTMSGVHGPGLKGGGRATDQDLHRDLGVYCQGRARVGVHPAFSSSGMTDCRGDVAGEVPCHGGKRVKNCADAGSVPPLHQDMPLAGQLTSGAGRGTTERGSVAAGPSGRGGPGKENLAGAPGAATMQPLGTSSFFPSPIDSGWQSPPIGLHHANMHGAPITNPDTSKSAGSGGGGGVSAGGGGSGAAGTSRPGSKRHRPGLRDSVDGADGLPHGAVKMQRTEQPPQGGTAPISQGQQQQQHISSQQPPANMGAVKAQLLQGEDQLPTELDLELPAGVEDEIMEEADENDSDYFRAVEESKKAIYIAGRQLESQDEDEEFQRALALSMQDVPQDAPQELEPHLQAPPGAAQVAVTQADLRAPFSGSTAPSTSLPGGLAPFSGSLGATGGAVELSQHTPQLGGQHIRSGNFLLSPMVETPWSDAPGTDGRRPTPVTNGPAYLRYIDVNVETLGKAGLGLQPSGAAAGLQLFSKDQQDDMVAFIENSNEDSAVKGAMVASLKDMGHPQGAGSFAQGLGEEGQQEDQLGEGEASDTASGQGQAHRRLQNGLFKSSTDKKRAQGTPEYSVQLEDPQRPKRPRDVDLPGYIDNPRLQELGDQPDWYQQQARQHLEPGIKDRLFKWKYDSTLQNAPLPAAEDGADDEDSNQAANGDSDNLGLGNTPPRLESSAYGSRGRDEDQGTPLLIRAQPEGDGDPIVVIDLCGDDEDAQLQKAMELSLFDQKDRTEEDMLQQAMEESTKGDGWQNPEGYSFWADDEADVRPGCGQTICNMQNSLAGSEDGPGAAGKQSGAPPSSPACPPGADPVQPFNTVFMEGIDTAAQVEVTILPKARGAVGMQEARHKLPPLPRVTVVEDDEEGYPPSLPGSLRHTLHPLCSSCAAHAIPQPAELNAAAPVVSQKQSGSGVLSLVTSSMKHMFGKVFRGSPLKPNTSQHPQPLVSHPHQKEPSLPPQLCVSQPVLQQQVARYRMHGVVCHRGRSPHGGHYVAHMVLPLDIPTPAGAHEVSAAGLQPGGAAAPAGPSDGRAGPTVVRLDGHPWPAPSASVTDALSEGGAEPQLPVPGKCKLLSCGPEQTIVGAPHGWQWWKFDDDVVTANDASASLQEAASEGYMVFLCLC